MSDAAEVMSAIHDSLRAIPGGGALVDAVFGLHVAERVHCACGEDSHANTYTLFFYNVTAAALREQARAAHGQMWGTEIQYCPSTQMYNTSP